MATRELKSAHPAYNKAEAARRNAYIARRKAASPWRIMAAPPNGVAFIATRFFVDAKDTLWATDSDGNDHRVLDHWLQTSHAENRHGGKRVGAGRKALPPEQRKVARSVMLSPDAEGWILYIQRPDETFSAALDRAIRVAIDHGFDKPVPSAILTSE